MKKLILNFLIFLLPFELIAQNNPSEYIGSNLSRGTELRILRLAVSSTGEYTQSVPGAKDADKVNEVLRQLKAWLEEINTTYGREYSVRFELVSDEILRKLIFTNPASDPWPNMSGAGCDGAEKIHSIQGKVIDELIGVENYDFSHVVLANYNGGCAGWFKGGYSGGLDPGVTRHEMGHQFQQSHTVNYGDNTNYEPENAGRSIHGGNSHPYAHAATFQQLALHLLNNETKTGRDIATGNHIPTVDAGPDRAIPIGTPFYLFALAEDTDADDKLTYVWDQMDRGRAKSLPNANDLEGALFSRLVPSLDPTRFFPNMESVITNNFSTTIEQLPIHPRDLNFRVTVNDNHQFDYNGMLVNASGINSDDIKITVVDNGGAFKVSSQGNGEKYIGGSVQTITWNVNGTNKAPINTQNVKISMSCDGGQSFPIELLSSTPNNGKAEVVIPNVNTKLGRIRVESIDNYFFAINTKNFTINQNASKPGISIVASSPKMLVSENGYEATYTVGILTNPSDAVEVGIITMSNQVELSTDGTNFSTEVALSFTNTEPVTITVRGKYDDIAEGMHTDIILPGVLYATKDENNYPEGMLGEPITVNISDAQIPSIVGIDFDAENSVKTPTNWVKVSDIRNQVIKNIPLDDGEPTTITLTTTATNCGIGGCGFEPGHYSALPKHAQSLEDLSGITVARGTVTFTWSGLEANTKYRLFIFGLAAFGPIKQTVTMTGSGSPITFNQNSEPGRLFINDKESSGDLLVNFAKQITSTKEGTITITVVPNPENGEMSIAGLGICK